MKIKPIIYASVNRNYGYCHFYTLNKHVAKRFNQMATPGQTIIVSLDMSKIFNTINIHTLIRNLILTKIPCTLIKFLNGHIAYTTYRNHTSSKRPFKTGVPLQTYHHPEHRFRSLPTPMPSPSHLHTQA